MRALAALVSSAVLATSAPAVAQDDFSFEIVEEKAADTDKRKYDDARAMLAEERYSQAIAAFEGILADPKLKRYHEAAKYDIAKALYRYGAYHAALTRFEPILEEGPKNRYYKNAREWLFFVARRVRDELGPLSLIAQYAKPEDLPPESLSEFSYQLARYHYLKALEQGAKGVEVEQTQPGEDPGAAEQPAEEEGFDFGDGADKAEQAPDEKPEEGGFDFAAPGGGDDDGFGFDFSEPTEKKKDTGGKKKPAGKRKGPKAKGESAADKPAASEAPKAKAAAKDAPKKTHKNENPSSAEESLKLALTNLDRVQPSFSSYAKSLYLKGLCHFGLGDFDKAVAAFRNVVRMTSPRGEAPSPKLREMAFYSLARIHYQFEQFRYAVFYYDRIDRDSESWLDAVFESSWAHFRLGEYEKALGNLVTIQSPFFVDEYYPESHILKAITFYENCRYPEARAFLGEFKENYDGVVRELERLVAAKRSPEELYGELTGLEARVAAGDDDPARSNAITARIIRLALSDKRLASFREAILEVEGEKATLAALGDPFVSGKVYEDSLVKLDARRKELVVLAGKLLADKLAGELTFLKDLQAMLLRIQFEIAKGEKEGLEAELRAENQAVALEKYKFTTATDDEREYWPFEGEYWRDELGTYEYTLTRGCRPRNE